MSGKNHASKVAVKVVKNYVRGVIAIVIAYGLWRGIRAVLAWVEPIGTGPILFLILALVLVPPVLGWLIGRLLYPQMRRIHTLRALLRGEERFVAELAPGGGRGFPVALVAWPSPQVRSVCVITATYPGPEPGQEFAAVYLPGVPDVHRGTVRVVVLDDLEIIDWNLTEALRLHMSYGTHSPGFLCKP